MVRSDLRARLEHIDELKVEELVNRRVLRRPDRLTTRPRLRVAQIRTASSSTSSASDPKISIRSMWG